MGSILEGENIKCNYIKEVSDLRNQFLVEIMSVKSTQAETSKDIKINKDKISRLEKENSAMNTTIQKLNSAFETARDAYFVVSGPSEGKIYLLSREASFYYPSFGESVCALYGGYLVELDTMSEFDIVRNFSLAKGSKFNYIMTGGTDEGHYGVWINRYSKTPMAKFWYENQPNNYGGMQHCQTFNKKFDYYMDDTECHFNSRNDIGFICEVPL
ncbi:hypothetical protein Btru_076471 [Bulinus truncatus]|nr:hypothetical protein Btru_076471 [Bulinus truncatus]